MSGPYHSKLNTYHSRSGGQALILILLVMSVSLLIGVGISFRTTSTLRQISSSEQSARAYSFAEAGAEEALKKLKDGTCPPPYTTAVCNPSSTDWDGDGRNDFSYSIDEFGNEQVIDEFSPLERGKNIQINLDGFPGGNFITLYWVRRVAGDTGDSNSEYNNPAALVIHFVYLDGGVYKLESHARDPYGIRRSSNKFEWSPQCGSLGYTVDGITYQHRCRLRVPDGAKVLRLTPLYNDGVPNTFAAYAPPGFPRQGAEIIATGESGQAKRKVEVIRTDPILPGLFDYVYFSGSSL